MTRKRLLLPLTFLLAIRPGVAAPGPGHAGFTAYASAGFGGDSVATVYFSNGENQTVNAGQGLELGLGGHYRLAGAPIDLNATVGYKYVTTAAENADIHLDRMVLELRADYLITRDWWVGAGPVWHTGIRLNTDGIGENLRFGTASGVTFKVGWKWVGLAFTSMTYQDTYGTRYGASNLAATLVGKW